MKVMQGENRTAILQLIASFKSPKTGSAQKDLALISIQLPHHDRDNSYYPS
jgi:hypothetical protein